MSSEPPYFLVLAQQTATGPALGVQGKKGATWEPVVFLRVENIASCILQAKHPPPSQPPNATQNKL